MIMTTLSATQARGDLFDMIKSAIKKHQLFRIHHREGGVVLMSEDDYESLVETLEILSAPHFKRKYRKAKKEIQEGRTVSFEKVFA